MQKAIDTKSKATQDLCGVKEIAECDYHNVDIIERELIQSLSQSLQVKGILLLERLKASDVSWNSGSEIIISSTKYDGTDIVDLVNDVMRYRKYSAQYGWEIFDDQLTKMNVLQEMMVNRSQWN